ncbi:MAG: dTMP kinase [Thermoguttaceae bacterium]|nr:dTMP kinase [Thermoguttaceae bacterium]MDW8078274.1 dTMP kinase [Thermoguttaceae bacterium]
MFIAFEGGDGVGKTTQLELLAFALAERGWPVVCFRDPGSTALGEELRGILLRRQELPISPVAETLLYMAARAQLVDEKIRPALAEGKVVLCDRFLLSNVVYQGYGCGLDPRQVWEIGRVATGGVLPTLTLVLDLPEDEAVKRRKASPDRLEARDAEFHRRVREGFLAEAAKAPTSTVVVDASPPTQEVHRRILEIVLERLHQRGKK